MNWDKWLWTPVEVPRSKRLLFVDALRGVLIILVVWFHFEGFWTTPLEYTPNDRLVLFRMPAFFFIMGYFSAICFGSEASLRHKLRRRVEVQLIPTAIFLAIFCLIYPYSFDYVFVNPYKCGFWFTWSAVVIMMVYGILWMVSRRVTKRHFWQVCIVCGAGVVISKLILWVHLPAYWDDLLSFSKSIIYLIYFLVGVVCREFAPYFIALLQRKWLVACLLAVAIIGGQMGERWPLWDKVFILAGIIGAFGLFYHLNPLIEGSRAGRFLAKMGQYTLEIYLVQALLFGWHPDYVGWIPQEWSAPVQIGIRLGCSVALVVVIYLAVRLLPSWAMRVLFGRKESSKFASEKS